MCSFGVGVVQTAGGGGLTWTGFKLATLCMLIVLDANWSNKAINAQINVTSAHAIT